MTNEVAVIPGDGIGQQVVPAAVEVLGSVAPDLAFLEGEAGDEVAAAAGTPLPEETRDLAASADATLFGAAGETAADVVLPLRSAVGSFVNVRPARAYPGVDALRPETDVTFLRENTEGVYAGHEARLTEDVATLTRVSTRGAARRLAEYACDHAERAGLEGFTVAHKADVMRETDGLFLEEVTAVADERGLTADPVLMDALAMHLCRTPADYDLVVCPNLAGDVLSDQAAGLVGGLGLLPSANVGPERGLFESVHGSAPDIAGEGVANPTATLLSAAMVLAFLDRGAAADELRAAVLSVLESGPRTPDVGGSAGTDDVTAAVLAEL